MVGFKKKAVSTERVAAVESAAASAPIVGDPRLGASTSESEPQPKPGMPSAAATPSGQGNQERAPATPSTHLGSIQGGPAANEGYRVGMLYEIPLGILKSNPVNPRAVYTAAAVDEMATSLSTSGQRIAATAYVGDQGEPILIEGETRLRGARAAGLPTLRVEIRPRPECERELYEEARAANVERREQTPLDDAIRWKELLAKKIYPTQAAIAKAMKLGEDHVSRTLSLAALPSRIVHACAEHPALMTHQMLNAIREFWEVKASEDETIELVFEVAKTGMGYRDVIARRKSAAKGPVKRPRSSREALTFKGAKGEFKTFEEDGRIELILKGLSPAEAEEIGAKIKALFPKGQGI
jgi:ParB family chromosome partitioning protein